MFSNLNYVAIVVCGIVYWGLGALWYALAFTKIWMKSLDFSPELRERAERDFPKAVSMHFVNGLITSLVMANIVRAMGAGSFVDGMICGFWMWLGFAFTINFNSLMFQKRPGPIFLINSGYYLIAFTIVGGVLAVWR